MVTADMRPDIVPEVVDETLYASWTSRVLATVVDGLVLGGLFFLVAGAPHGSDTFLLPVPVFGSDAVSLAGTSWATRAVLLVVVLLLVLAQAYGGASPGKRIVGIAVVDDQTGRPVGLALTLLRSLAHLLDAILLIGYLRPIWHVERRTFADSVTGTVVLRTRTVRPNLVVENLVRRRDGLVGPRVEARGSMGEPATGPWENRVTGGVAVVSVVLAMFSLPWTSASAGDSASSDCSFPILDSGSFAPTGVLLHADGHVESQRRLWVETTTVTPADTVVASWSWHRTTSEPTTLRLVATAADGVTQTDVSATTETIPAGTPSADRDDSSTRLGDLEVDVASLGPGWTAETEMLVGGEVVTSCSLSG